MAQKPIMKLAETILDAVIKEKLDYLNSLSALEAVKIAIISNIIKDESFKNNIPKV